jgi:hypothetical protein
MKLWTFLLLLSSVSHVFSQGTILFDTRVPGIVDAPFSILGEPVPPGFGAQLFLANPPGTLPVIVPLKPTTTFQAGSSRQAFYVAPVVVTVP